MLIVKSMHLINLHFWTYINNSLHLALKYTRIRGTDMYKDKFAPNGAIVFIILQIYFARAILKLGNI